MASGKGDYSSQFGLEITKGKGQGILGGYDKTIVDDPSKIHWY
jgi:hypothetical protein